MSNISTIDLSEVGTANSAIKFTGAERLIDRPSSLVLVHYEENGKKQEYGLRLDLDKGSFLDHLSDPQLDASVKGSLPRILEVIVREVATQR